MWTTTLAEGDRDDGGDPMDGTQPRAKRPASGASPATRWAACVSCAIRSLAHLGPPLT